MTPLNPPEGGKRLAHENSNEIWEDSAMRPQMEVRINCCFAMLKTTEDK